MKKRISEIENRVCRILGISPRDLQDKSKTDPKYSECRQIIMVIARMKLRMLTLDTISSYYFGNKGKGSNCTYAKKKVRDRYSVDIDFRDKMKPILLEFGISERDILGMR